PIAATSATRHSLVRRLAPYAAMLIVALVTGTAVWRARQPVATPRPLVRFAVDLATSASTLPMLRNPIAISPDGSRLVYVANQRLYVRALDQLEATPIAGSESATPETSVRAPFFSPDSQWIGFWQDRQLKKIAITGGAAV